MRGALQFLEDHRADLVRLAQELIQTNSVHGNETAVAHVLRRVMLAYGLGSRFVGRNPKRRSLVADLGRGERTLMFNGHLDTVPFGDLKRWKHHPLSGKIVRHRLFGRGAYDMKSSVAAATFAAIALYVSNTKLGGRVRLLFNSDEESGAHSGVQDALDRGITADAAVCVEPMENKQLCVGARGVFRFELITHGRSGHTGYRGSGVNAVAQMAKLLLALEEFRFQAKPHPLFDPPYLTAGTMINGGTGMNVYPFECRAVVDCRLVPGQSRRAVAREIRRYLMERTVQDRQLSFSMRELSYVPAVAVDRRERIIEASQCAVHATHGFTPKLTTMGGTTDGNFLVANGIPTVILGVEGGRIHQENEYASIPSIHRMAKTFVLIATNYLAPVP